MLPLPTPEGPARTKSFPVRMAGLLLEPVEELRALLRAEPPDATARRDVELLHQLLRADLADARERFEDRRHLHLPHDVVVGTHQHVTQRPRPRLQLALELRALLPRLRGFRE